MTDQVSRALEQAIELADAYEELEKENEQLKQRVQELEDDLILPATRNTGRKAYLRSVQQMAIVNMVNNLPKQADMFGLDVVYVRDIKQYADKMV